MAYLFTPNNTLTTGPQQIWVLIVALVAAGWVVKSDSDGTTYAATGGQITGSGSGARGLANNSAWIRVQSPLTSGGLVAQKREFVFQRGTTDRAWRVKYSAANGFTVGSPAITVTPQATDEVVIVGAATDAAPTFLNWMTASTNVKRWHIACGQGPEFYSFYAFETIVGTQATPGAGLFLDVMAIGSYPAQDIDPAVVYASDGWGSGNEFCSNANAIGIADLSTVGNVINPVYARAWLGPTSQAGIAATLTNNQRMALCSYGTNGPGTTSAQSLGRNPWNNIEDLLPAYWMRGGFLPGPVGLKGRSTLFLYGTVGKANMHTIDYAGVKDFVSVGGNSLTAPYSAYLPWGGVAAHI